MPNLIRTLGEVRRDEKNANDVAGTPHELTVRGRAMRLHERKVPMLRGEVQAFLAY